MLCVSHFNSCATHPIIPILLIYSLQARGPKVMAFKITKNSRHLKICFYRISL